jgi:hypothetical protein
MLSRVTEPSAHPAPSCPAGWAQTWQTPLGAANLPLDTAAPFVLRDDARTDATALLFREQNTFWHD